ncbi:hypothetical protein SteCoe_30397 [Stentor coeruleus]|uniref:Uncharacterized protein n=1 Tax=Stentor coeruleus TaxID=5963 RepID=A0A1R2B3T3_9CILI|nr:hypothetical protein SteCoe_30421 [Stentor coeruleus]OMJ71406.1 hypothetical protein SteCoe_30397 [Stentor coeruleus]
MVIDNKSLLKLQIAKRICAGSVIVFMILASIQLETEKIRWEFVFSPLLISFLLIPPMAHMILENSYFHMQEYSKLITLFVIYNFTIVFIAFFILLAFRLENVIEENWVSVFVPIWYGLIIYLGYSFFLIPGMIDKTIGMYRQAIMLILWFVAVLLTTIFCVCYLETDFPTEPCIVLSPVIILGAINLIFWAIPVIRMKINPELPKFNPFGIEILWIGTVIPTVMITLLKIMVIDIIPYFVLFLPTFKLTVFSLVQQEKLYSAMKKEGYQYIS